VDMILEMNSIIKEPQMKNIEIGINKSPRAMVARTEEVWRKMAIGDIKVEMGRIEETIMVIIIDQDLKRTLKILILATKLLL